MSRNKDHLKAGTMYSRTMLASRIMSLVSADTQVHCS